MPDNGDGTLTITRVNPDESTPEREWLEKRQGGIGGSDAAAVLGLSPWKSPYALWAEKCGLVEHENLDEIEHIQWGKILEEPIAKRYVLETRRTLIDPGRFAIQVNPLHPVMHCTIDREIMPIDGRPGPGDLSIKNAGEFRRREWEEEAPLPYQVQLQHELVVTGLQWGSFAVLIGGNKFAWLDTLRNEKFCRYLIEQEEMFWDRVVRGDPPPADASDSTKEVLLRLYPKDDGSEIALPHEAMEWSEQLSSTKEKIKSLKIIEQDMENRLKSNIGGATFGILADGTRYSWRWQERKAYSVERTEFRVLRKLK
jgi:putative phage-type endonuclease